MKTRTRNFTFILILLLMVVSSCNLPAAGTEAPATSTFAPAQPEAPSATAAPTAISHVMFPSNEAGIGGLVFDVRSDGTAPERRAPYGDAYNINRFERPFTQDMTYVSDMDIVSYNIRADADWFYVSIELIGNDPNNQLGIHYGVEFDQNWDGYGEYIVWGIPPYTNTWTTDSVQVFKDSNNDSAGLSSARSDAPFDGNGYDTMIFDRGVGDDSDLAWMRVNAGERATVQFAIKRALLNGPFMFGVVADAGLRDVGRFDYNDRFVEIDAGSPEISEPYYPLKEVFAVDNSCQTAVGFKPSGYEPKLCPVEPTPTPGPNPPGPCQPPGGSCPPGWWWEPEPLCYCNTVY
jgi:hypothetical protein